MFILIHKYTYVYYLDNFYVTSRRNKIRKLPLGKYEQEGADKVLLPKMIFRRFPIKSLPYRGFGGKILLE